VPSVGFGTATTQLPVTFACAGAALGAATTGAGVTTTGAVEQPAMMAVASAVAIGRAERIRIGMSLRGEAGGFDPGTRDTYRPLR
jgi:hypothetical protein